MQIINIKDEKHIEKLISDENKLVVIDFYADWCGPCKSFGKYYEEFVNSFVKKYGKKNVAFCKINVDKEELEDFCSVNEISSIPCVMFIKGNRIIKKMTGNNSVEFKNTVEKLC